MCGRVYQTYTAEELYFQYLNKHPLIPLQFTPVYNLCPTQNSPVLRLVDGERQFDEMRWQLVPELGTRTRDETFDNQRQERDSVR
jgi:putative SOS response-associated peptidase YedK